MPTFKNIKTIVDGNSPNLPLRCPHCRKNGIFTGTHKPLSWQERIESNTVRTISAGARICPNPQCLGLVFFIINNQNILATWPPETIDFDTAGVPAAVREALEEAISCHANGCYRATALLVRRTLEEICVERGVDGRDLKQRIAALGDRIIMPRELLDALDQLRILGNDAAHIEARIYDQIGSEETDIAILLTKEILKATYQYVELVAKLRSLGRNS